MYRLLYIFIFSIFSFACLADTKNMTVNPNEIEMNEYVHNSLPKEMLKRIRATTEVFEIVDGISYEKAVDLYKRDYDPESNLQIWEEMARVYTEFCKFRCKDKEERMDVYRILLLRSMWDEKNTLARAQVNVISNDDAKRLVQQYKLKPQPIEVIKK